MRRIPTATLQASFPARGRSTAVRQVLGIVTVFGLLAWARPATVSAQAIGTLQVEARVTSAESEWSSLRAAQQLAGNASATASPITPSRVALPLSEIQWLASTPPAAGDGRPVLISVQYLRN